MIGYNKLQKENTVENREQMIVVVGVYTMFVYTFSKEINCKSSQNLSGLAY